VSRWIAHVDMDAFFVAVELLRRPELRGKPVVVATGTDPNARGVVMAASYEARKFGVHSAVPLAVAHRRCPQAILIPRDLSLYRDVSRKVMAILKRHSDRVEVAGLDEAYLDLSHTPLPKTECRAIKHEIKEELGLVCSVGLAPNKLLAKIASDLDKPDGFRLLRAEEMLEAVGERPASLIPGVGPKTAQRLAAMRIRTVSDLARADRGMLVRVLGPALGSLLHARANGSDGRELETKREPKSESRETTFATDVDDPAVLHETLGRLATDLCKRLAEGEYAGRTVTLKIRLRPFRTHTRSRTLESPTRDAATVGAVARSLLDSFEVDAPVRLLGVGLSSLTREVQADRAADGRGGPAVAAPLEFDLGT
jgi:nucleotidyltransferase/DNA polymerase involved in DNA repair